MIKIIQSFLVVFCVFYFGIDAWRHLSGREKWDLTKLVAYSAVCAVLTVGTLAAFVFLF